MSKLAIVILNWNGKRFLERFLPTLLRTLPDYAEVVVCDNASKDDSVAFMEEHFPQVKLLLNERNEGFARGYNLALQRVEAKYYCLLNSDIEVTDGWIEPVIEQMDANEKIAAVQPKLRSFDRRDEFEYAGASGGYIASSGPPARPCSCAATSIILWRVSTAISSPTWRRSTSAGASRTWATRSR